MKFKLFSKLLLMMGLFGLLFGWLYFLSNSWILKMEIFSKNSFNLDFLIMIDWISILFFSILLIMVSCVLKFSKFYMNNEMKFLSFSYMLLMFVVSMSFLIFFPSFIFLLLGWDGLGMTSFLLIIYYLSKSSWSAGLKTYLINRLGDSFLLISIVILFCQGHWNIFSFDYIWNLIYILLLFGFITKSALFPFSSWLPAAMAAPTPVSALVHSSTLVTAGIYLIIRLNYFFPSWILNLLGIFSLWTIYSSSFSACLEWDSKKIIAYSTLSQLGLMGFCLSLGLNLFAFFHLLTHAVFKALLFICVGYWMKMCFHFQDLRGLNNLWSMKPYCNILSLISILALSGFPFLAGFYSKDKIIESNLNIFNSFFFFFFLFTLPLTSFYSFRLLFLLLNNNMKKLFMKLKKTFFFFVSFPLVFLSMFLGMMMNKFLFIYEFPSIYFKMMILFFMLIGFVFSLFLSSYKSWMFSNLFYKNSLKNFFLYNFSKLGNLMFNLLDSGWKSMFINYLNLKFKNSSLYINYSIKYFFKPNPFFYVGWMMFIIFMMYFIL